MEIETILPEWLMALQGPVVDSRADAYLDLEGMTRCNRT